MSFLSEVLKRKTVHRLVRIHNIWLAKLHVTHMYEKTLPEVLWGNNSDQLTDFICLLFLFCTCVALSCCISLELKCWFFRRVIPMCFDETKDQTNIVPHGEEKKTSLLCATVEEHLTVLYLSSAFEVISLLMLPVWPELQELVLIAPRERGEWLRSNRFYVIGITVIWIQNIGSCNLLGTVRNSFSYYRLCPGLACAVLSLYPLGSACQEFY